MAEKRRFIDVWLVEPNTVYREVPFNVVTDWVGQSRLVADDMIRPSGTAQWFRVGDSPDFNPFLPKAEPVRIEDEATALEPVDMGFNWKRAGEDEDDDCDMIPLIDVSLVLLIFFMLTSSAAVASLGKLEPAFNGFVGSKDRMHFVDVYFDKEKTADPVTGVKIRRVRFSLSSGENPAKPLDTDLVTLGEAIDRLKVLIGDQKGFDVTIRADTEIKSGLVRKLTVELTNLGGIVDKKYIGVNEKEAP